MVNPIKQLPQIMKTPRLEMRQLAATYENAEMIFDAIKNENPSDFYFNPIGVDNIIPQSADEVLKWMQRGLCKWRLYGWFGLRGEMGSRVKHRTK